MPGFGHVPPHLCSKVSACVFAKLEHEIKAFPGFRMRPPIG
jgi:hypothetical protein